MSPLAPALPTYVRTDGRLYRRATIISPRNVRTHLIESPGGGGGRHLRSKRREGRGAAREYRRQMYLPRRRHPKSSHNKYFSKVTLLLHKHELHTVAAVAKDDREKIGSRKGEKRSRRQTEEVGPEKYSHGKRGRIEERRRRRTPSPVFFLTTAPPFVDRLSLALQRIGFFYMTAREEGTKFEALK